MTSDKWRVTSDEPILLPPAHKSSDEWRVTRCGGTSDGQRQLARAILHRVAASVIQLLQSFLLA